MISEKTISHISLISIFLIAIFSEYFNEPYLITLLSIIVFVVASKGLSILYLFLLADLFCCSAAVSYTHLTLPTSDLV